MKNTTAILLALAALFSSPARAQWDGGECGQPAHVTINRYNYYGYGADECPPAYTGWRGAPQSAGRAYHGRPVNLVASVLSVLDIFRAIFPPRRREVFVQCPTYQSPAPVIIER